jgi:hypothetical protein
MKSLKIDNASSDHLQANKQFCQQDNHDDFMTIAHTPHLLCISIPSYKRLYEFDRLLRSICSEVASLPGNIQELIIVKIFENPSDDTKDKEEIFNNAKLGLSTKSWHVNRTNIGGDANIEQAYIAGKQAKYTWVIGDDDQIEQGGLARVLSTIKDDDDLALLIIRDKTYRIAAKIQEQHAWTNYQHFARDCQEIQPHLLIAHTLISSNIIGSKYFEQSESLHERSVISKRSGLPFCFAHMKGFLKVLSRCESAKIKLLEDPVIDTSMRSENSVAFKNHDKLINRLYKHHLEWLCHEFGLCHEKLCYGEFMQFMLPSYTMLTSLFSMKLLITAKSLTMISRQYIPFKRQLKRLI